MKNTLVLFLAIFLSNCALAQETESSSPIIFIYDASGSMWGKIDNQPKKEIASEVFSTVVNNLPENQKVGLVAYGHRKKADCKDVEYMVKLETGTKEQVSDAVKNITPLGKTPLAHSALLVINQLRESELKATIILITDGIESCDGNICDVISRAKNEGIDFKLHIIGFGLQDENIESLKCAAEAGEGNFYSAEDAGDLVEVLDKATSATVDAIPENFTVFAVKHGKPIDAWVRAYDMQNESKPISVRTYRDTAGFYLPPSRYKFHVQPLEGSDVEKLVVSDIESFSDRIEHQTFSFDGGIINVATTNNGKNWDCIVKLFDEQGQMVASVRTYTEPKEVELNPGRYHATIQALAMEGIFTYAEIPNVIVKSASGTSLACDFNTGNFEIFTQLEDENIDAIVTIKETTTGKNVAGSRTYTKGAEFLLNPGVYEVKAIPLGVHKGKEKQIFQIEILQGKLISKTLQF